MKECPKCKVNKPFTDYSKNKSKKDGLQRMCKKCVAEADKKHYNKHYEKHKEKRKKRYKTNRTFINKYKKIFGICVDCKTTDWRVLEFDHVRGIKKDGISELSSYSIPIIKKEIRKCEVRCANCHRIKTYERRNKNI